MPDPTDPKSLKELLFETVETFEELEVLAWFHDRGEGSVGGAILIGQQTVASIEEAKVALASLVSRGILSASSAEADQFLYAPSTEVHEAIHRIVGEYRDNPVQIIGFMTGNAIERVRSAAVRRFADSFRIRRPK